MLGGEVERGARQSRGTVSALTHLVWRGSRAAAPSLGCAIPSRGLRHPWGLGRGLHVCVVFWESFKGSVWFKESIKKAKHGLRKSCSDESLAPHWEGFNHEVPPSGEDCGLVAKASLRTLRNNQCVCTHVCVPGCLEQTDDRINQQIFIQLET